MAKREKKRRSRGSGGIVKLSSGYYAYQFIDTNGTRKTKSLRVKSRKEAESRVANYSDAVLAKDRDEVLLHAARSRKIISSYDLPFEDVWNEFLKTNPTAGEGTLGLYQRSLKEFVQWLKAERPSITSFTQIDLQTAVAYMEYVWQSGVSASTYNDKRNALGLITKKLANRFGIEVNPWPQTERKKGVRQVRLPLSREQVADLMKRLEKTDRLPYPKEITPLVYLCLFAGMRLTVAVCLEWGSVDLAAGCISYTPAKTARTSGIQAQVPILPPLDRALRTLTSGDDSGYVLPEVSAHYKRNPDFVKQHLVKIIQKVTGDGKQESKSQHQRSRSQYGVHSLRHTFATEAARAGVPPVYLSLMTGDTLQTLQRFYVKIGYNRPPVVGFEYISRMIEAQESVEPEREKLRTLIDEMPISSVRELLAIAEGGQLLLEQGEESK